MKLLVEMIGEGIVAAALMAIPILTGICYCLNWGEGFCILLTFFSAMELLALWMIIGIKVEEKEK